MRRVLRRDEYPEKIATAVPKLAHLSIDGALDTTRLCVAIVGAREATAGAIGFARSLAASVAGGGGIVLSGGARGVDRAAHEGALDAGGTTWLVAPCGSDHCSPSEHRPLYDRIVERGGAVLFPFDPGQTAIYWTFHHRNEVLAALADVVVVIQASIVSGTRNTAAHARKFGRQVWAVPGPPWLEGFEGCAVEIESGAVPLVSCARFLAAWRLGPEPDPTPARRLRGQTPDAAGGTLPLLRAEPPPLEPDQKAVFDALDRNSKHLDEVASIACKTVSHTSTILLTLALENVVVEDPPGFFRRSDRF